VKPSAIAWSAVGLILLAGPALAHHSYAMFDRDKELKLEGTVKTFAWTNPHSWIEIDVPNASGGVDTWGVEGNSPNNLARMGWKSTSLKPGDKVTISIHPLRSGEHGGSFMKVTFPDGHVLGEMTRTAPAPAQTAPASGKSPS
jgi:hypothetical protein